MLQCSHRRKFISHLPLSFSSPIGVCCSKTRLHARMAQQRVEVSPRLATAGRGVWVRCHDWPVCQNVWVRCHDLLRPAAAFGSDAAAYHDLLRCLGAMVRLATTCSGVWEWCRVQGWDWDLPLHLRGMLQSATVFGSDAVTCHDLPLRLTVMPQIAKVCRGVWGLYCNLPQCLGVRPRFASLLLRLGVMSWPSINPWSKKPCIYSIVYSQTVVLIFLTHTLNRTNWKALTFYFCRNVSRGAMAAVGGCGHQKWTGQSFPAGGAWLRMVCTPSSGPYTVWSATGKHIPECFLPLTRRFKAEKCTLRIAKKNKKPCPCLLRKNSQKGGS